MSAGKLEQVWNAPTSGQEIAQAYVPDGVRIEFARPGARLEGREAIAAHAQGYVTAVPDCVLDIQGRGDLFGLMDTAADEE